MIPNDVTSPVDIAVSLPSFEQSRLLAGWTQYARQRAYRIVDCTRRTAVVEVGSGWGCVAEDLASRTNGSVLAVDRQSPPLDHLRARTNGRVKTLQGDVHALPLSSRSADLVVSHFSFLWFSEPRSALAECLRILRPGGALVLAEPDFGGLMEFPDLGLRQMWLQGLARNGAHATIGRQLPAYLADARLDVQVLFYDRYEPLKLAALSFLSPLANHEHETEWSSRSDLKSSPRRPDILFLPIWIVVARLP